MARTRAAMARSAWCRPARKTHGVPPTRSATSAPAARSASIAASTRPSGASSNPAAAGTSSAAGRPQCPSSIASARACETPARKRMAAVFSMPSRIASVSAVLKPMPRMSRERRYGFVDITSMASAP